MITANQNPEIANYTFNEHKHRYAIWTAARAVQRSFTTTIKINAAINATSLRTFSESNTPVSQDEYDVKHREWSKSIIACFDTMNVNCSYGRAAKIIAIYLKTAYVLPTAGEGNNFSVIHPPLDRILLSALAIDELTYLKKCSWTTFTEAEYWQLVNTLRSKFTRFDWTLEAKWKAVDDDE